MAVLQSILLTSYNRERNKMLTFELLGTDLTEDAQKALCELLHINSIEDSNWDVIPLTVLEFDENEWLNNE